MASPIYNRFKYYSALKTGFEHLAPQENAEMQAKDMFDTPEHLTNQYFFVL